MTPFRSGMRALELACAEGHFTVRLAAEVTTLLATDISEVALVRARRRCAGLDNVDFMPLDLMSDPIPGPFDLIVCSEVLYYLKDRAMLAAVAAKLAHALAVDGSIVLAHANVVVDEPTQAGFDWPVPFGAKTIGDVLAAEPLLSFDKELRTPFYRIQLFKRADEKRPGGLAPRHSLETRHVPPKPDVAGRILWEGGTVMAQDAVEPLTTRRLPILMYHSIAAEGGPALARFRTHPQAFEEQLRFLRDLGFRSVSFDEWREARRLNRPLCGSAIMLTFDDGYKDFLEAWPLLRRYGFAATVFIVTARVGGHASWDDRYGNAAPLMDWNDIRLLYEQGVSFGSHGVSHSAFTSLENDQLVHDLLTSRRCLERFLETPVSALSYPYGLFTPEIARLAQACGYSDAVSVEAGCCGFRDDPLALPRIEIPGGISPPDFISLLDS